MTAPPTSQHNDSDHASPRRPMSLGIGKKIAFAMIACVLVFATAEGVLRLCWTPPPPDDPFVGFSAGVPLLVKQSDDGSADGSDNGERIGFHPAKLVWFNEQSFAAKKPPGTYRIVCLGGSTTFGRPFNDTTSFCGWLREMLPLVDSTTDWEVINAGGISYASYRVARVMQEFAEHDVDLFILYTGQNEFLEHRTYADLMQSSDAPRRLASLAA